MPSSSLRGLAQVSLAAVLWGTGGLTVQVIRQTQNLSPLTLSAERALIGAVALLAVVAFTRSLGELGRLLRARPGAVVLTGLGTAAYQGFYFVAVTDAGVAIPTVISLGLAPVLLAGAEAVRAGRWPTPGRLLILLAAVAGLLLVSVSSGAELGPHPVRGVLLSIASGTIYAVTTRIGQSVAGAARPVVLTTGSMLVTGLVLAPLLGLGGEILPASPGVAVWLLYLGVGTMATAYLLFYGGLRTVSASSASVASLLEPVTAAVVAAIVLGEQLGVPGLVGTALVLVAVAGIAV